MTRTLNKTDRNFYTDLSSVAWKEFVRNSKKRFTEIIVDTLENDDQIKFSSHGRQQMFGKDEKQGLYIWIAFGNRTHLTICEMVQFLMSNSMDPTVLNRIYKKIFKNRQDKRSHDLGIQSQYHKTSQFVNFPTEL